VAKRLGNTKTICRKCYVHPAVIDAYLDGTFIHTLSQRVRKELMHFLPELSPEEAAVLAFLQERLKKEAGAHRNGAAACGVNVPDCRLRLSAKRVSVLFVGRSQNSRDFQRPNQAEMSGRTGIPAHWALLSRRITPPGLLRRNSTYFLDAYPYHIWFHVCHGQRSLVLWSTR
jgi:hypothetical protein